MNQKGDGRRVSRVEKEVHASIATYLIRSFRFEYGIVTVTKVILTADLRSARVYVSLMEGIGSEPAPTKTGDHTAVLLSELKHEAVEIQNHIAHELKLRFVPKLQFYKDETTDKVLAIEKTLFDLKKQDSTKK